MCGLFFFLTWGWGTVGECVALSSDRTGLSCSVSNVFEVLWVQFKLNPWPLVPHILCYREQAPFSPLSPVVCREGDRVTSSAEGAALPVKEKAKAVLLRVDQAFIVFFFYIWCGFSCWPWENVAYNWQRLVVQTCLDIQQWVQVSHTGSKREG